MFTMDVNTSDVTTELPSVKTTEPYDPTDPADDAIWILTSTFIIFTMQSGKLLLQNYVIVCPDLILSQKVKKILITCTRAAGAFLSEVNNRETIAAIEVNNDTYCLQKRIEKFPLNHKM